MHSPNQKFRLPGDLGPNKGGINEKPSVPKCSEGISEILSGKLYSSLAVFYVEQVALNRHVCCNSSFPFMLQVRPIVKQTVFIVFIGRPAVRYLKHLGIGNECPSVSHCGATSRHPNLQLRL
jgi:hypothetical protein